MLSNFTTTTKRGSQQRNIQRCTACRHTGRSRASTVFSSPAFLPELFNVSFVSLISQAVYAYASVHTGYSASSPSHSIFPTAIRTNSKLYNCFTRHLMIWPLSPPPAWFLPSPISNSLTLRLSENTGTGHSLLLVDFCLQNCFFPNPSPGLPHTSWFILLQFFSKQHLLKALPRTPALGCFQEPLPLPVSQHLSTLI